jgi:AcrR family transcriptional regulator
MTTTNWLSAAALAPRTMPRQARAIARRRAILDAAFALLGDHGVDAITTLLIAQRAGIPVASVYAYFPNKMAVLAELVREATAETDTVLEGLLAPRADRPSIERAIDSCIDAIIDRYQKVPARQRLISAVRGNPVFEPIMRASAGRMAAALAANLERLNPDLPKLRARAMALTVVQTFVVLQDGIVTCPDAELTAELVAEWRNVVKSYLTPARCMADPGRGQPRDYLRAVVF